MHFRFRYNQTPGLLHTYIRVFAGRSEASLGLCGSLTMRNEEFDRFKESFDVGTSFSGETKVEFIPDDLTS